MKLRIALAAVLAAALLLVSGAEGCLMRPSGARVPTAAPGSGTAPTTTPPAAESSGTPIPAVGLQKEWSGFEKPVYLTNAGDGSRRLFVCELPGRIRVIDGGRVLPKPLLDISDLVSTGGERGFFAVAFPPGYASSGVFYVSYTDRAGDSVIARYRVNPGEGNVAEKGSGRTVLHVAQPYPNHNGGQIAFGRDGMLYVGLGDGGSEGDPNGNGQRTDTLLGKILRIDVSHSATYAVPPDNPFVGRKGVRPEIWDIGLRNPWRFSFDQLTGDLYIGDVGQDTWEEIDFEPAGKGGRNYGWNVFEGLHPYDRRAKPNPIAPLTMPVAEYSHAEGISVSGGFVYRGTRSPSLRGVYFFGDYGSGRIWGLVGNGGVFRNAQVAEAGARVAGFGQDEDGEVYVLGIDTGDVLRIVGQ